MRWESTFSAMKTSSIARESQPQAWTQEPAGGPGRVAEAGPDPDGKEGWGGNSSWTWDAGITGMKGRNADPVPTRGKTHPTWMETCVDRLRIGRDDWRQHFILQRGETFPCKTANLETVKEIMMVQQVHSSFSFKVFLYILSHHYFHLFFLCNLHTDKMHTFICTV